MSSRPYLKTWPQPLLARRLCSTASVPQPPSGNPTVLGVSLGATVASITFTVIAWPLADLFGAPVLIAAAIDCPTAPTSLGSSREAEEARRLQKLLHSSEKAKLLVVEGGSPEHQQALVEHAGRPTVRLSLREATAPHSLLMSIIEGLYRPLVVGQAAVSIGFYWLTLFDLLVSDHGHIREVNLRLVLSQFRRGIDRFRKIGGTAADSGPASALGASAVGTARPLIVVEHLELTMAAAGASGAASQAALAPMVRTFLQFLAAISLDEERADVLILAPAVGTGPAPARPLAAAAPRRRWSWGRPSSTDLGRGATAATLTQGEVTHLCLHGLQLGVHSPGGT